MKYLCNVSGGLCSFWAWHRTVQRYGVENVVPIFADVMIEDADLYKFNEQAAQLLKSPITRISLEITPWELFRREGLLGNNRFPICSVKLKREPLNAWMASRYELDHRQTNALMEDGTVVLGFDWTEHHRVDEFQAEHPTWRVLAPMTEEPLWDKCRMLAEAEKLGFERQRLYKLGFPHANCGGGCVKAGISHFVNLYYRLPEVFWQWAAEELYTRERVWLLCVNELADDNTAAGHGDERPEWQRGNVSGRHGEVVADDDDQRGGKFNQPVANNTQYPPPLEQPQHWPTPQAMEGTKVTGKENQDSLTKRMRFGQADQDNRNSDGSRRELWATPRSGKVTDETLESWTERNEAGDVATMPLTLQAKAWSTPHQNCNTGAGQSPEKQGAPNLQTQAAGKLNPHWVSCLMGYPPLWCELGRKFTTALGNSKATATPSSHKSRKSLQGQSKTN